MTGYELLQAKVTELAKELPGITFGYIGNCERWGDDRSWSIFLPHPGRVGRWEDAVYLGPTKKMSLVTEADWPELEAKARRLYAREDRRDIPEVSERNRKQDEFNRIMGY